MDDINFGLIAILLLLLGSVCSYGIGRSMAKAAEKEEESEENASKEDE